MFGLVMNHALSVIMAITLSFTGLFGQGFNKAVGISNTAYNLTGQTIPGNAAQKLVNKIKVGIDLGNTFDASDCSWVSDELDYESAWCGAKTTKAYIKKIKSLGFNAIRIPVSWHNHVSGADYTISEAWLDRVQEVVDWCIDEDMYVIINIHHDNTISTENNAFFYPSTKYIDQSEKYVKAIWTQLSAKFKDYDTHLIFESLNEPRLVGTHYEWWADVNNADCIDAIKCINKLNQDFVDTVRASGGNNAERFLMVPGYDAAASGVTNKYFVIPTDTVKNRIILTVHAYTPYNFALQSSSEGGSVKVFNYKKSTSYNDILSMMKTLYSMYVSKGQPVMIDEFGARNKGNTKSRAAYARYFVAAGKAYGISCFWWDNNYFENSATGEAFGIVDRTTCKVEFPAIVSGLMKYAKVIK